MKEKLVQLLEECLENGTETDIEVLRQAIIGVQRKMNEKNESYVDGLLHMERKIEGKSCEIVIPINPLIHNSFHIAHGGITATLIDTAMGTLVNVLLPKGYGAVTNQLNIHYLSPGIGEHLRCKAEIVHQGSKTMVVSAEAFRSDGKKVAQATGSFFVIEKKSIKGE
jgi:uncharacterized protein (TIGR00369 family)